MSNAVTNAEKCTVSEGNHSATQYLTPSVNIYENKDGYQIEAEMPGVRKEDLEVTLDGNELLIVGHRQPHVTNGEVVYRESQDAGFRRSFELDPAIDTTKIVAKIEQGFLTVKLPKAEVVKPRRIAVND